LNFSERLIIALVGLKWLKKGPLELKSHPVNGLFAIAIYLKEFGLKLNFPGAVTQVMIEVL
jgi:hypothetical protein